MNAISEGGSSGFLHPNRKYYIMKLKEWYPFFEHRTIISDIYDENGTTIGLMRIASSLLSGMLSVSVEDTAGARILTVEKKSRGFWSSSARYEINDKEGNMLYFYDRSSGPYDHSSEEPLVVDAADPAWYRGMWGRWIDIKISDTPQKRKVAEFCRTRKWKDVLAADLLQRDTYALHILDPSYDKRVLIGFVIGYVDDYLGYSSSAGD